MQSPSFTKPGRLLFIFGEEKPLFGYNANVALVHNLVDVFYFRIVRQW